MTTGLSRLIVKGLPKHMTEARLRDEFSEAGEVTDVKVMKTADGRSRQFGFVGFRREEDARNARRLLNQTFLDTSRLTVDFARPVGDGAIPRAWSKYTKEKERKERETKETSDGRGQQDEREKNDDGTSRKRLRPKDATEDVGFQEFAKQMRAIKTRKFWSNADGLDGAQVRKIAVESKKAGGKGIFLSRTHVTFDDSGDEAGEDDHELDTQVYPPEEMKEDESDAEEEYQELKRPPMHTADSKALAMDTQVDDLAYFRSKVVSDSDSSISQEQDSDENSESENSDMKALSGGLVESGAPRHANLSTERPVQVADEQTDMEADILDTGRLFLRNLAFSVTEQDIEATFERFGVVSEVHLCLDSDTKKPKGTAYVLFVLPENAARAKLEMDGKIFQGRLLHVIPARKKPEPKTPDAQDLSRKGTSSYKREQEANRKEKARNRTDSDAWNALFMATDAVASVVSDRMNLSKRELYGSDRGDSGTAAVRLAAAEAQLQQEARSALREEGVNVDAFGRENMRLKRSRTIILAKNLPKGMTLVELHTLFGNFGPLGRVSLVPSSLIALVEFLEPGDARRAYNSLAYTKHMGVPIYLEWAPNDAFLTGAKKIDDAMQVRDRSDGASHVELILDNEDIESPTVFVKNLNFDTTEGALEKLFSEIGSVRSCTIVTRKGSENQSSTKLSRGYGFVEYELAENAKRAIQQLQGRLLDGHMLSLRVSENKAKSRMATDGKESDHGMKRGRSTKLLVRNVPFEATRRDIRDLFSTFGQLKSVRLPTKMDGNHRGFAFVDFASKGEAASAKEMLKDTHLYGRHLVLEYAKPDQQLGNS